MRDCGISVIKASPCALLYTSPFSQMETGETGREIKRLYFWQQPWKAWLCSRPGAAHQAFKSGICAPCKEAVEHMFLDRKYKNKMKIHKRLLSEAMSCILQVQWGSLAESLWRHQSLTGSWARKISAWKNTAERLQFIHTGAIRIFPMKLLSPGKYIWKIHMMPSRGEGCWPAGMMPWEGHQARCGHWQGTPGL